MDEDRKRKIGTTAATLPLPFSSPSIVGVNAGSAISDSPPVLSKTLTPTFLCRCRSAAMRAARATLVAVTPRGVGSARGQQRRLTPVEEATAATHGPARA